MIDVTLACGDANSKLVNVVTVADEDRVGNNLLQIWKLRFGQDFEVEVLQDLRLASFFSADLL